MKLVFNGKSNEGGIYKILNVNNGRVYIGSTYRFKTRAMSHYNCLLKHEHQNQFLQHDFDKCGKEAFIFEVLEVVQTDEKDRLLREQFFIDQHYDNQKQCYNIEKKAGATRKDRGNVNEANRENDKRCRQPTEETRLKRQEAIKEAYQDLELRKVSSDNAMKRWQEHSAKIVLVHKDTKEEVLVETSLRQFALDRNLSYKSLHQLVKGKTKSCGGWYLKVNGEPVYRSQKGEKRKPLTKEHKQKISNGKYQGRKLVHNVTGEFLIIGPNTKEFATENGMYYTTLLKVLKGESKTINGFVVA